MKLIFLISMFGLLLFHLPAHAEGGSCPKGYYPISSPGVVGCAPIPGYNQGSQSQPASSLPPGRWESRWGAIASDGYKGALGVAVDMSSRSNAEKVAMQDCKAKGGTQCVLDVAYDNSCAAMVVGDNGYSIRTGSTKEEAVDFATKACSAANQNCHAYYTNCAQPQLIR